MPLCHFNFLTFRVVWINTCGTIKPTEETAHVAANTTHHKVTAHPPYKKSVGLVTPLHIQNAGQDEVSSTFDLEEEMLIAAERDRVIELRVKFGVHGMHGTLTHKTPLPQSGPNAKKLAESRWKTLLPLEFPPKSR